MDEGNQEFQVKGIKEKKKKRKEKTNEIKFFKNWNRIRFKSKEKGRVLLCSMS